MIDKTLFKEFVEEYNDDKIDESSIQIFTTRVKVFLVNSKDEVLIATSGGGCQLPEDTLKRVRVFCKELLGKLKRKQG